MSVDRDLIREELNTEALNAFLIERIQDIKAKDIVKLDLRKLEEAPTDFFIICEGESLIQVKAIADHIISEVKKHTGQIPNHVEGKTNSTWILVDYFTTVVHIFFKDTRKFYQLESLWSDADTVEYENL
ncbi:MAG: ribosome silencing factor [Bacteroidota bacterium]